MGMITITRTTKYPDRYRAYTVMLDGGAVGRLKGTESITVQLEPGQHTLLITIDWCMSNRLTFDYSADADLHFACGSNMRGWKMILAVMYVTFLREHYLWLRQVDA
jgi:hypothetical protein